jgi:nucleotide-binding universal stress UspA family protein
MLSSIVVGSDGSDTSHEAVRQAAELARRFNARLHIVCAYTPVAVRVQAASPVSGEWNVGPEVVGEEVLARARGVAGAGGADVETHAVAGDAPDALIEVAEQEHADLIVVGNRGMQSARRFVLGNVPNKVSHNAPCSVYIVRTS